jgi:hypothetical protein
MTAVIKCTLSSPCTLTTSRAYKKRLTYKLTTYLNTNLGNMKKPHLGSLTESASAILKIFLLHYTKCNHSMKINIYLSQATPFYLQFVTDGNGLWVLLVFM